MVINNIYEDNSTIPPKLYIEVNPLKNNKYKHIKNNKKITTNKTNIKYNFTKFINKKLIK